VLRVARDHDADLVARAWQSRERIIARRGIEHRTRKHSIAGVSEDGKATLLLADLLRVGDRRRIQRDRAKTR
jgi:hypothetical protein